MAPIATEAHLPALDHHHREEVGRELQATLVELIDLSLVGKQLHWNIFGRPFKPLHEHPRRARRLVARALRHHRGAGRRARLLARRAGPRRERGQRDRSRRSRSARHRHRDAATRRAPGGRRRAHPRTHGSARRDRPCVAGRPGRGRAGAREAALDAALGASGLAGNTAQRVVKVADAERVPNGEARRTMSRAASRND